MLGSRVNAAAAVVACVLATAVVSAPAGPAFAAGGGGGSRAGAGAGGGAVGARPSRSELVLKIASLTDQLDAASADVVGAQLAELQVRSEVEAVRARVRARAVAAYIRGVGLDSPSELAAPSVYLEVTARKERDLLAQLHTAASAAAERRSVAERASENVTAIEGSLTQARAQLADLVAAEEAQMRALQAAADAAAAAAARRRAQTSAAAAAAAALARARAGGGAGGADLSGLLPRHLEATRKQAALMTRYPFGVLPPGPLPASLGAPMATFSGQASWYGGEFNGRPTASGAIYDEDGWTVASKELPLGSLIVVSRGDVRVLLLVNDRGPYVDGRVLDLSAAAARALQVGVSEVDVTVFPPAPGS